MPHGGTGQAGEWDSKVNWRRECAGIRSVAAAGDCKHWSLTTLRDRLVQIGAKIVRHGCSITFPMAEVMVTRGLFQHVLDVIAALRSLAPG